MNKGFTMPRRQWTATEIRLLAAKYPEEGLAPLVKLLPRSEDSITSMASRLGLRSQHRHRNQAQGRSRKKTVLRPKDVRHTDPHVTVQRSIINPTGPIP